MRTIKFRAWSFYSKKMYSWAELCEYSTEDVFSDNPRNEWYGGLMQYIGLKDKTGKEIYVADVYRDTIEYDEGDEVLYYICVWLKEISCFGWLCIGDYHKWQDNGFEALDDLGIPWNCNERDCKDLVIIGNAYETPRYLKP